MSKCIFEGPAKILIVADPTSGGVELQLSGNSVDILNMIAILANDLHYGAGIGMDVLVETVLAGCKADRLDGEGFAVHIPTIPRKDGEHHADT